MPTRQEALQLGAIEHLTREVEILKADLEQARHERDSLMADLDKIWDVDMVSGVEGPCLCIGDPDSGVGTRVAGPKPWGGGRTVQRFQVSKHDILEALGMVSRSHVRPVTIHLAAPARRGPTG